MPPLTRHKTKYPGVFFIDSEGANGDERIYYIRYRRQGKMIEEKAGRQYQDDMTPSRAAKIRGRRIEGDELPNTERRNGGDRGRERPMDHCSLMG